MKEKTIFERSNCQNRIWKSGLYDYLYKSTFSVRFAICDFYIRKYFDRANILDIGAGSGTLFLYVYDIACKYFYSDISKHALSIFESSKIYKQYNSNIEIILGNVNEIRIENKYEVIVSLGIAKFMYDKELFHNLFYNNLSDNGIMILETSEDCDGFSYYNDQLPKPIHSIKYEILDDFDFGTTKVRILNVYKNKTKN